MIFTCMYPNAEFDFNGNRHRFQNGELETTDPMLIKFLKDREIFIEKKQANLKDVAELKNEIKEAFTPEVKEEPKEEVVEVKEESKEPEKKKYFSK